MASLRSGSAPSGNSTWPSLVASASSPALAVDALLGRGLVGARRPAERLAAQLGILRLLRVLAELVGHDALVGRLGPLALVFWVLHGRGYPSPKPSSATSASASTCSGGRSASITAIRSGSAAASSS